ncbi:MAG: putative toxin-antitoxin system toxin component, PIN family [Candidatus Aminicenantales bacterium]
MRAVVDTNVFVSSFFGGIPWKVMDLWKEQKITLCLSRSILDEYVEVLRTLGLGAGEELREVIGLFGRNYNLLFTVKTPKHAVVKDDPGVDKFIECAVALKADAIITGDRPLKAVGEYLGIAILSPAQFLDQIAGNRAG